MSIADILHTQAALFPFMQFMKSEGALNILQFCLTVGMSEKQLSEKKNRRASPFVIIAQTRDCNEMPKSGGLYGRGGQTSKTSRYYKMCCYLSKNDKYNYRSILHNKSQLS